MVRAILVILFILYLIWPPLVYAGVPPHREGALVSLLPPLSSRILPVGTIVPAPSSPEIFSDEPTPVLFRIINRGAKPIYLQGVRHHEGRLQIYLYHRREKEGWKPYFDALPCDLPTCRNLHVPRKRCKEIPYVILLSPAGSRDSLKEVHWEGVLYQRIEATHEGRTRRYCYKGSVPKEGRIRAEIEFSDRTQKGKRGVIGPRNFVAVEFDLPPLQKPVTVYLEDP